jgi:putative cardiolipin synthase
MRTIFLLTAVLTTGCVSVPFDYPKSPSESINPPPDTFLSKDAQAFSTAHEGQSGFLLLTGGQEALGARLRLIEEAEVSIDAQYFLIKPDMAGALFAESLLVAADRGVSVRFLVDDIFTPDLDRELSLLNAHPNIEVRLFSPLSRQSFKYWSLFADFRRANRRMHNKSFTVDNSFTIVGGRNIAEEYFQLKNDVEFIDLELLALGPIAQQVSNTFDLFWNSQLAVPVEAFKNPADEAQLAEWRESIDEDSLAAEMSAYNAAINHPLLQDLINDAIKPLAAPARIVTDTPEKLTNATKKIEYQALVTEIERRAALATSEIIIISPYFVPGKEGADLIASYAQRGVRVAVLTNSLASTNHVPVHSGYARYRKQLLEAGVELYEVKADFADEQANDINAPDIVTLHTKAIIFDRNTLFVGSLNLDPRSIEINSEMGLFIESRELAETFMDLLMADLPMASYRVSLNEEGQLRWHYEYGDSVEIVEKEPQASFWRRFTNGFYRLLPIEGQL